MHDARQLDVRGTRRLAQADGAQPSVIGHLFVEGAHRFGQLAVDGMDHDRGQLALKGQQQALESSVIVDDVEALAGHGGVDASQVGRLAGRFRLPAEIVAPGGVSQHRHPFRRPFRSEYGDVVSQPAQLGMEQVDDEFGAAVATRRQGVPGGRHDRDP